MIKIQKASDVEKDFFASKCEDGRSDVVKGIINDVKKRGDDAIREYAVKFDAAAPKTLEISQSELKAAADKLKQEKPDVYKSLCYSRDAALRFAKKQKESFCDFEIEMEAGLFAGQKNIAVKRAGVYVPAGRFPLVSTVVMTVMPAVAAGVPEIIMCTPPKKHPCKTGEALPSSSPYADEAIMAASYICGVKRVFACGGAQAIAAMAFGTESVPRVDVIAGPGNKFVAEAKRLVYGSVGIDMVAGPTEVLIIADDSADCVCVASDLLAQAEHDVAACPVLVTTSEVLAHDVALEIEKQLSILPTKETAKKSISDFGRIIIAASIEQAADIANKKAPEHLELSLDAGKTRDKLAALVYNYGSLFIGHGAAEVLGDYAAGINHTLPTSGGARFTGGLSVRAFLKTVTTLRAERGSRGAAVSATAAAILGEEEGLAGHAAAARLRMKLKGRDL